MNMFDANSELLLSFYCFSGTFLIMAASIQKLEGSEAGL
jgi:hypothetical protein